MPVLFDIWRFGPNDPILQLVSFDYVKVHIGLHATRCLLATLRRGREGKFLCPSENLAITAAVARIRPYFNTWGRSFSRPRLTYPATFGSMPA